MAKHGFVSIRRQITKVCAWGVFLEKYQATIYALLFFACQILMH